MSEWKPRWLHFTPEEIFSSDTLHLWRDRHLVPNPCLLDSLEVFRAYLCQHYQQDTPVIVTSALRSRAENKRLGGAPDSLHLYMCAVDIQVPPHAPSEIARLAERAWVGHGIGLYSRHVHLDLRWSASGLVTWRGDYR